MKTKQVPLHANKPGIAIMRLTFSLSLWIHKLPQHQIFLGFFQQHAEDHSLHALIVERYQKISLDKICVSQTNGFSVKEHTKQLKHPLKIC